MGSNPTSSTIFFSFFIYLPGVLAIAKEKLHARVKHPELDSDAVEFDTEYLNENHDATNCTGARGDAQVNSIIWCLCIYHVISSCHENPTQSLTDGRLVEERATVIHQRSL